MSATKDEAQRASRNMPQWEFNRKMLKATFIIIPILILLIYISFIRQMESENSEQNTNNEVLLSE